MDHLGGVLMCGLAGRFHAVHLPDAGNWAARADALLAHRGPDGSGHFRDKHCELVHRRLAIIDLSSGGAQPMANEDGTIIAVFNGEIYNHADLRRELQGRGHRFRSAADTEVLVHLYEEVGAGLVDRLRGIFAFAIYDRPRRQILLARDRFGVKPLFYTRAGSQGQYVFASELKAITALPDFRPRIDRQACYDFLGLGYIPEPATGFTDVWAVPKGCTLRVSDAGRDVREYYAPAISPDPTLRQGAAVDALAEGLLNAVGRQSVADVRVASLLSGGIDSSLVVAAHRRSMNRDVETFNVRFPGREHDETPQAEAVARHYDTAHCTVDISDYRLNPESMLDLLRHFDQPFADTACIPTYWVSRAMADRQIVCALSGDGGDEAYGGYPRFWRANRLMQLMLAPSWIRTVTDRTGHALARHTRDLGRQVTKATGLARAGLDDSAALIAGMSNYLSEAQKAALLAPDAREHLTTSYRHFNGHPTRVARDLEDLSSRMTEALFAVSLPSKMLRKVDMMSMRASIEVRVPLLDEELVTLGCMLPHRLKTNGRTGKLVPRALARRWLPKSVAGHGKHGFDIPLDVMVPPELHTALRDLLTGPDSRTRPFLNHGIVQEWLTGFAAANDQPRDGAISRAGVYQRVITVLSLELWLRDYGLTW